MLSVEQQLSEAKAVIVTLTKEVKELKESHATAISEKDKAFAAKEKEVAKMNLAALIEKNNLSEAHAKIVNAQFDSGVLSTPELMTQVVESFKQEKKIDRKNGTAAAQITEANPREADVPVLMRSYNMSESEARMLLGLPTNKERK